MAAIQFPDRGTAVRVSPAGKTLTEAVVAALSAPSVLNTQPWRWQIDGDTASLRADRTRQLPVIDPDGRLLAISCGVALHHAMVALAADGAAAEVLRLPDPEDPDLLATLRWTGTVERAAEPQRLRRAMSLRRTDRRPFADLDVPEDALDELRAAARAAGATLHVVRREDLVGVVVAAGHAADVEERDPAYRAELAAWVHPEDSSAQDGVPVPTTDGPRARLVPIRDFGGAGERQLSVYDAPAEVADRHARYAVLCTGGDLPADWLTAGEALSAVLLSAVVAGLAASPMSDLVEVEPSRAMLRRMLGGVGHPAMVLRVGVPGRLDPVPGAPRRRAADVVEATTE